MNEPPKSVLKKDGIVLLRKLRRSYHPTFKEEIYNGFDEVKFPKKYRHLAKRVHHDPLFILSFGELKTHLTRHLDGSYDEEEKIDKLLVFYSVFILNVTGARKLEKLYLEDDSFYLRTALKNYEKFNTVTNLIYKLLFSKNIKDVEICKGEEWKELVDKKRRSINGEPFKYFKDTYGHDSSSIKTLLKCEIYVQRMMCNRCFGYHFTQLCTSYEDAAKVVLLDRWMNDKFDYDIDERLKDVLKFPLFSVYLALAVCKGKNAETVCHSITDL